MALSMLGLRVRVFDLNDAMITTDDLSNLLLDFDALVAPQIERGLLAKLADDTKFRFLLDKSDRCPLDLISAARPNVATLSDCRTDSARWAVLCDLLRLERPVDSFPVGTPPKWRLFRDDRDSTVGSRKIVEWLAPLSDNSAWALTPAPGWPADPDSEPSTLFESNILVEYPVDHDPLEFGLLEGTFPGNLASFEHHGVACEQEAMTLTLCASQHSKLLRPYRSGALVSSASHHHGRVEAEIRAARGEGLITGFFLHRARPRQEIDFEIMGNDPTSVLLNVYFNPGDAGTSAAYGYRGSPCRISLGFDASTEFHQYSIEWRPHSITWAVDGRVIHRRGSWDPTPVPHLPMKLHFNLWAPRSRELAGHLAPDCLPAVAKIRNIRMYDDVPLSLVGY